ncbi:MAG: hypothetical protein IPL46_06990 [Saprospiraceae bacterium]|nr:hypothetical protein [Saprospiraceae bacterium]
MEQPLREIRGKNPNELIRDHGGSAADINLFTIALLQEVGINAEPIILSTRNNGKIRSEHPIESLFNYVAMILTIDDKIVLADATDRNVPFDRLPIWCLNDKGLIIRKNDALWADLQTNMPSEKSVMLNFKINPQTSKAELSCVMHTTELEAYHLRDKFKDDTTLIKELFLEKGFENVSVVKTSHYETTSGPYVVAVKGTSGIDQIDDQLIITPLLHFPTSKMPFTQQSRSYPIDFISPQLEKYKCQIDLPDGYSTSFVPEDFTISNDLVEVQYSTLIKDSSLEINGLISFKKSVYPESDYSKLKFYFQKIIDKFNEQVVLKQKKI